MKHLLIGSTLVALITAGAAFSRIRHPVQAPGEATGRRGSPSAPAHSPQPLAPPFVADDAEGRGHSLEDLCRDGPAILVFVLDGCPCSDRVQVTINSLHGNYGRGASFAAIFSGDADAAYRWSRNNGVRFPLLLDPSQKVAGLYGVESSGHVVLVGRGGRTVTSWPVYSASTFRDLGKRLAESTGLAERTLDLSKVNEEEHRGCPY